MTPPLIGCSAHLSEAISFLQLRLDFTWQQAQGVDYPLVN
jgi:hypothetical protein